MKNNNVLEIAEFPNETLLTRTRVKEILKISYAQLDSHIPDSELPRTRMNGRTSRALRGHCAAPQEQSATLQVLQNARFSRPLKSDQTFHNIDAVCSFTLREIQNQISRGIG